MELNSNTIKKDQSLNKTPKQLQKEAELKKALLTSDKKIFNDLKKYTNLDVSFSKEEMIAFIGKGEIKMIKYFIKFQFAYIDTEILILCLDNRWDNIFIELADYFFHGGGKTTDNRCIVKCIQISDDHLCRPIVNNPELDFFGKNSIVLEEILKHNKLELLRYIEAQVIKKEDFSTKMAKFLGNHYEILVHIFNKNRKELLEYLIANTSFIIDFKKTINDKNYTLIDVLLISTSKKLCNFLFHRKKGIYLKTSDILTKASGHYYQCPHSETAMIMMCPDHPLKIKRLT